jgi:hypothetical protein
MSLYEALNLSHRYDQSGPPVPALCGFSLRTSPGGFVAIAGPFSHLNQAMPFRRWDCAPLSRSLGACCRFGERFVFPSRRHFTMRKQHRQPYTISNQLREVAEKIP